MVDILSDIISISFFEQNVVQVLTTGLWTLLLSNCPVGDVSIKNPGLLGKQLLVQVVECSNLLSKYIILPP